MAEGATMTDEHFVLVVTNVDLFFQYLVLGGTALPLLAVAIARWWRRRA
jgi:hypothetical protein